MDEKNRIKLIERYSYLYENKEIILSLAINLRINKKEIKKSLNNFKKLMKRNYSNDIKDLIKDGIASCKMALKEPKYYLFKDIDDDLVDIFSEFLFSDLDIVDTELYKKIEMIKNDLNLYEECVLKIEGLLDRRKNNRFLEGNNPFTVWKILTYVRNKNINNKMVLDALDKYYNIERYMLTGINFDSGYIFLESDEELYDESLNKIPYNMIIGGVRTTYECSGIMLKYDGNEFEHEDDYFVYSWLEDIVDKNNCQDNMSYFMKGLVNINNLSLEEKEKIYRDLVLDNCKILKR